MLSLGKRPGFAYAKAGFRSIFVPLRGETRRTSTMDDSQLAKRRKSHSALIGCDYSTWKLGNGLLWTLR